MALFGRKPDPGPVDVDPDPFLPLLTVRDADDLRRLAILEFARRGEAVTVDGDGLSSAAGWRAGLYNLSAACAAESRRSRWSGLVADHVELLMGAVAQRGAPNPSADEIANRAVSRVVDTASTDPQQLQDITYARALGGGLLEALVIQEPHGAQYLTDATLGDADLELVWPRARERLRALDSGLRTTSPIGNNLQLTFLGTETDFTASFAIVLADLVPREATELGLIFSIPFRRALGYFPVVPDVESVERALGIMAGFAKSANEAEPGPVSASVFLLRGGRIARLTGVSDTGELGLEPGVSAQALAAGTVLP